MLAALVSATAAAAGVRFAATAAGIAIPAAEDQRARRQRDVHAQRRRERARMRGQVVPGFGEQPSIPCAARRMRRSIAASEVSTAMASAQAASAPDQILGG
jgi:hypothetical protein